MHDDDEDDELCMAQQHMYYIPGWIPMRLSWMLNAVAKFPPALSPNTVT